MSKMRTRANDMADKATETLGPPIMKLMDNLPIEKKLDVLLRFCCATACMAVATKRSQEGRISKSEFYEEVERFILGMIADLMPPPRGEDFKVVLGSQAQAAMDADPELAATVPDILAKIRQALDGVATGQFADHDEAMKSLGAKVIIMGDDENDGGETLQ